MTVEVTWHEHVLVLAIARPERRNAVDHATLVALASGLEDALAGAARAVVLTGHGGSFCAGADLAGVEDEGFSHALSAVLHGLTTARAVTIAAVDGPAHGAGQRVLQPGRQRHERGVVDGIATLGSGDGEDEHVLVPGDLDRHLTTFPAAERLRRHQGRRSPSGRL